MRRIDCESLETILRKRNIVFECKTTEEIKRFVENIWGVHDSEKFHTPSQFRDILDKVEFNWEDIWRLTKIYGIRHRVSEILDI